MSQNDQGVVQFIFLPFDVAKERGIKWYYTGAPCKNGHVTLWHTKHKKCMQCMRDEFREYHNRNREKRNARCAIWNKEKSDHRKKYYLNTRRQRILSTKRWAEKNKEKFLDYQKQYYRNNRDAFDAKSAKRRAAKQSATPAWADLAKIADIYKNRPPGYHVDHIVPLRGRNVCGLHVEYNLQYLPASINQSKGNGWAA